MEQPETPVVVDLETQAYSFIPTVATLDWWSARRLLLKKVVDRQENFNQVHGTLGRQSALSLWNTRTGFCSSIYHLIEQVLFNPLCWYLNDKTLDWNICTNFWRINASNRVCEKLLSNNSFAASTAMGVRSRATEPTSEKPRATKMQDPLNVHTRNTALELATSTEGITA